MRSRGLHRHAELLASTVDICLLVRVLLRAVVPRFYRAARHRCWAAMPRAREGRSEMARGDGVPSFVRARPPCCPPVSGGPSAALSCGVRGRVVRAGAHACSISHVGRALWASRSRCTLWVASSPSLFWQQCRLCTCTAPGAPAPCSLSSPEPCACGLLCDPYPVSTYQYPPGPYIVYIL